jgi:putative PIN family toxin of toxin-antitoxin system
VRVVLDTNTLVSAVLSPEGPPRRLLDAARGQAFEMCTSPVLLAELQEVLGRDKFALRFRQSGLIPSVFVREIHRLSNVITPAQVPPVIAADADDDHVLACAVTSQADLIVSGDKHLLSLGGSYLGIAILRPVEAVAWLGRSG